MALNDSSFGLFWDNVEVEPATTTAAAAAGEDVFDDNLLQILRDCLEEFDEKSQKLIKKLLSKVEKEIPLERFVRELLKDYGNKPIPKVFEKLIAKLHSKVNLGATNEATWEEFKGVVGQFKVRTVNRGGFVEEEEEEQKLERFKVKTVILGGVVKEEQK